MTWRNVRVWGEGSISAFSVHRIPPAAISPSAYYRASALLPGQYETPRFPRTYR